MFICTAQPASSSFFQEISLFLFTRTDPGPTKRKLKRNRIYVACGLVMVASLIATEIFILFFEDDHPRSDFEFWTETIALVAFGVSWLTKGGTLYPDKKEIENKTEEGK